MDTTTCTLCTGNPNGCIYCGRQADEPVPAARKARTVTAQDITPGTRTADGSVVERVVLRPSTCTVAITWSSGWIASYGTGHTFRLPRSR